MYQEKNKIVYDFPRSAQGQGTKEKKIQDMKQKSHIKCQNVRLTYARPTCSDFLGCRKMSKIESPLGGVSGIIVMRKRMSFWYPVQ